MGEKRNVSGSFVGSTVGVAVSIVGGISVASIVGTCVAVDVDSMVGVSVISPPHADSIKTKSKNIKPNFFIVF
jgi:hypothetical protein